MILIKVMFTRAEIGAVIGLRGQTILGVREQSKAIIKVDKDNSDQQFVTLRGEWESILKALNLIFECTEDKNSTMGRNKVKLILQDTQCKRLVASGALLLKRITKENGVKVSVSPLCLPGSTERVVRFEEGRLYILKAVKLTINLVVRDGDVLEKQYTPPILKTLKSVEPTRTVRENITVCKSLQGILALGNKLGVKIHHQKETEVIVEGPIGGVEMMKKILSSTVTDKDEEKVLQNIMEYVMI